ncbi:MAG TPA: FtsX-like permease family protein [Mycobacteriales bacterium]|nr:FtsX-like permease family protein [Mycobacteriales bacterium]
MLVLAAAQPGRLRSGIAGDTSRLAVLLGIITLIVAAFGIANSMLISVLERRAEIGLRRAMGASRRGIAWLFLTESAMLGVVGGFVGYAGGQILSIVVSAANGWYPIKLWYLALTPLLGMMVGVLAGVYPALKAARQEPVEALRA